MSLGTVSSLRLVVAHGAGVNAAAGLLDVAHVDAHVHEELVDETGGGPHHGLSSE